MKILSSRSGAVAALCLATGALLPASATAQSTAYASQGEKWEFAATIYGYLPSIGGKLSVPVDSSGTNLSVSANQIIDSLKMTFMGTLDAHYGQWGAFTDVLYLDVGGSKSQTHDFSVGRSGVPASTTADINLASRAPSGPSPANIA